MTENVLANNKIIEAIINAKQGDEHSYSYLIEILRPALISISKKYHIPKGEFEDLYQVCLIGLYKGILSFNSKYSSNPISFLKMCIKREIYDLIRNSTRQKHISFNDSISIDTKIKSKNNIEYTLHDTLSTDSNFLDNIILEKEYMESVQTIMNKLTKLEKDIFSLYLEGFSQKEISISLNISTKQIDNALQRSKRKMRDLILTA